MEGWTQCAHCVAAELRNEPARNESAFVLWLVDHERISGLEVHTGDQV